MLLDTNSALIIPIGFNSDLKGPKIIFLIFNFFSHDCLEGFF